MSFTINGHKYNYVGECHECPGQKKPHVFENQAERDAWWGNHQGHYCYIYMRRVK